MATRTVTTTAAEDAALTWMATQAGSGATDATIFDARVHAFLATLVQSYQAVAGKYDIAAVAQAFAAAATTTQDSVATSLSVPARTP